MLQLTSIDDALKQMSCIAAAEKPLIFIFTYLERHWIDRQIHDLRPDILPIKQLLWSRYDALALHGHLSAIRPAVQSRLEASWKAEIPVEELQQVALFVHYLRVISTPALVESDFTAVKRVPAPGLLINAHAAQPNRFSDFVQWYRDGIAAFIKAHFHGPVNSDWIQQVRNHLYCTEFTAHFSSLVFRPCCFGITRKAGWFIYASTRTPRSPSERV